LIFCLKVAELARCPLPRNTPLSAHSAQSPQKAIAFGYFALVARFLGVADTGKYFFALSWTLIFSVVTDLGLTSVLDPRGRQEAGRDARHLGQVMTMKLPLVVLAGISAIVGAYLTGVRGLTLGLISFGTLVLMLDAVSLTSTASCAATICSRYESLGLVVRASRSPSASAATSCSCICR